MSKEQWLERHIMSDEWGREPSLADVPLTLMKRKTAFKKRGYSNEEIGKLWLKAKNNA